MGQSYDMLYYFLWDPKENSVIQSSRILESKQPKGMEETLDAFPFRPLLLWTPLLIQCSI